MWKIPTQDRLGCGCVYSDGHMTTDQAQVETEAALGQKIESCDDTAIDAGRLSVLWIGHPVALGPASGFLEPLGATSIRGTVVPLMLLTKSDPALAHQTGGRVGHDARDVLVKGMALPHSRRLQVMCQLCHSNAQGRHPGCDRITVGGDRF